MTIQGYMNIFVIIIAGAAILYLPVFFILKKNSSYLFFFLSVFLIVFATIILFNLPVSFSQERHILNLQPLRWLHEGNIQRRITGEILPNIALFMPLGFFTPLAFKRLRKWHLTALLTLAVTFTVEFCQYFMGRSADIDDLFANLAGGLIGYGVSKIFTFS